VAGDEWTFAACKLLKEEESKIFGASNRKIGRSRIVIKNQDIPRDEKYEYLPYRKDNGAGL